MTRRLLLLHPVRLTGESAGLYIQHVASMQWLLTADHGWDVVAMDPLHPSLPDVALTSDLVVIHMLAVAEAASIIELRRQRGLRTLFEIGDNFLDIGDWLPSSHPLRNPLVRQQILHHASIADGVQVYSPGLADLFGHVHDHVVTLDPYVPLGRREREAGGPFVFGWGGTTSHRDDLRRIAPVIAGFCRRHPSAIFAYMGDAAVFAECLAEVPPAQVRRQPFGPYEDYLEFVSGLDAALAPLGASAFNACRTDTKFATYAARGVAAIVEDSDVYRPHQDRALLFRTPGDLDAALETLHGDPARRAELADRAYAWAASERSAERLRAQRTAAYEPLLPRQRVDHAPVEAGAAHAELTTASMLADGDAAVAALEAIVAAHPRYDQARLVLCRLLERRGEHGRAGAVLDAGAFHPVFAGVAADLRRRLHRESGVGDAAPRDPREYLETALRQHPYHYVALANRIRELSASDPDSPELPGLRMRACLIAPGLVPVDQRPPALARYLPA